MAKYDYRIKSICSRVHTCPFMTVNPTEDRSVLNTSKYTCYMVLVLNHAQVLEECQKVVQKEGVNSITFCLGFLYKDVAEISDIVGDDVGMCVARGDINNSKIVLKLIEQEL